MSSSLYTNLTRPLSKEEFLDNYWGGFPKEAFNNYHQFLNDGYDDKTIINNIKVYYKDQTIQVFIMSCLGVHYEIWGVYLMEDGFRFYNTERELRGACILHSIPDLPHVKHSTSLPY